MFNSVPLIVSTDTSTSEHELYIEIPIEYDHLIRWGEIKELARLFNQNMIDIERVIPLFGYLANTVYLSQIETHFDKDRCENVYSAFFSLFLSYIDQDKRESTKYSLLEYLQILSDQNSKKYHESIIIKQVYASIKEEKYVMFYTVRDQQQKLKKYYHLFEQLSYSSSSSSSLSSSSSNSTSSNTLTRIMQKPKVELINIYTTNDKYGYLINTSYFGYICPSRELFKMYLDKHLNENKFSGLLDNIDWSSEDGSTQVWLAGGCPFMALNTTWIGWTARYKYYCQVKRLIYKMDLPYYTRNIIFRMAQPYIEPFGKYFNKPPEHPRSFEDEIVETHSIRDYDFFIICKSAEEGKKKVLELTNQIYYYLKSIGHNDVTVVRTCNTFTIGPFTIILPLFHSLEELLVGFDLDCCCVAYNGRDVYAHPRALNAFKNRKNYIPEPHDTTYYTKHTRAEKYQERGFGFKTVRIHCKEDNCTKNHRSKLDKSVHPCYSNDKDCQVKYKTEIEALEDALSNLDLNSFMNHCNWAIFQQEKMGCMEFHHKHCHRCEIGRRNQISKTTHNLCMGTQLCLKCRINWSPIRSITRAPLSIVLCGKSLKNVMKYFPNTDNKIVCVTIYPYTLSKIIYDYCQDNFGHGESMIGNIKIIGIDHYSKRSLEMVFTSSECNITDQKYDIINLLLSVNLFKDHYKDNQGSYVGNINFNQLVQINQEIEQIEMKNYKSKIEIIQIKSDKIGDEKIIEQIKKKSKLSHNNNDTANIPPTIDTNNNKSEDKIMIQQETPEMKNYRMMESVLQKECQIIGETFESLDEFKSIVLNFKITNRFNGINFFDFTKGDKLVRTQFNTISPFLFDARVNTVV